MSQSIVLKRSAVSGKAPLTSDLQLGELAMNTFDGKLFLHKNNGTDSIVEIGAHTFSGDVSGSGNGAITLTLATVNSNVGTFGSATAHPVITVNGKGLITAVSTQTLSTTNVAEGSNLYFTTARATGAISVSGTGLSYASGVITSNATSANTASTIVARDASGNFTAGTVTAALTGNASTATALQTARSITATADASWTVNFDGSANASAALTLATVNSNVGTFASVTVNGKGLVTGAAALSGDATTAGSVLTLATVNSNTGSFGSSTAIPTFTVNGKGLITAASTSAVVAPAGTLTGATLASNVVSSSLTSVGTLTSVTTSGNATIGGNLIMSVATGISAAGTTQGTATAITKDINVVSTVAASSGVVLPTPVAGMSLIIVNAGANALSVYPPSGCQVDALPANTQMSLAVNARIMYFATSSTQWYTLNATYA